MTAPSQIVVNRPGNLQEKLNGCPVPVEAITSDGVTHGNSGDLGTKVVLVYASVAGRFLAVAASDGACVATPDQSNTGVPIAAEERVVIRMAPGRPYLSWLGNGNLEIWELT